MNQKNDFRSGFVAVVGKPNVGKSTLVNALLREKLSITTPKPQTTRQQIKGIYSDAKRQIIFLDTPGFLKPRYELQEMMLEFIQRSLQGADLILFVTDISDFPTDYDRELLALISRLRIPRIAILNKLDLVSQNIIKEKKEILKKFDFERIETISALQLIDRLELIDIITGYLPFNPPYYDPEEISDMPVRFFVQEIIREQIFLLYQKEIPYSASVVVERFIETDNRIDIDVNIWLERKSQKIIFIGRKGKMIKKVRENSEKEIYDLLGKRAVLHLWVKLKPHWRKKKNALKEFGYK